MPATEKPEEKAAPVATEIKVPLTQPITAHGKEITELVMRKPTGADLFQIGNPVNFNPFTAGQEPITFNMPVLRNMIVTIAGIPPSSVDQLHPNDVMSAAWSIAGFFIPINPAGS